jgi:hypothetical protein
MTGSFLQEPPVSPQVQALYDEDLADGGYVWNVSRLWAHQPDTLKPLFGLMSRAFTPSGLTFRQRGILVAAAASALGRRCSGGGSQWQRRRADGPGEGHRGVGPESRRGPERDNARRHPGAPRFRAR